MERTSYLITIFALDEFGVKFDADHFNQKITILSCTAYPSIDGVDEIIALFFEKWCNVTYDLSDEYIDEDEDFDLCLVIRNVE